MTKVRRIVITGASSGIGAALTAALAQDGHRLLVAARRRDRLVEVTQGGRLAAYAVVDVADEAQVTALFAEARDRFGALDAVIACAGAYSPIGRFDEVSSSDWLASVTANLFGTYLTIKHAVPLLRAGGSPRVVTFGGGGAFNPLPQYSAYAVSKAGVVRLTETIAQELAPSGIAVNAVAPGFVRTEIHDATLAAGPERAGTDFFEMTRSKLEKGGVPIEVPVDCVRFLLSDRAAGLTGKTLSASFDPWTEPEFTDNVADINRSDLYTMQRINLVHLGNDSLANILSAAAARRSPAGE